MKILLLSLALIPAQLLAHDGPDPLMHWSFHKRFVTADGKLEAQRGPTVDLKGAYRESRGAGKEGLLVNANNTPVGGSVKKLRDSLPVEAFTLSTWSSIHTGQEYGGFVSCLEDNGGFEKGFVLGYNHSKFYVGLATEGANDGDGKMTYLRSKQSYTPGVLYHVAATYDGKELSLYINGKLESTSNEQSGKVLYPENGKVGVGGYIDKDEDWPHHGEMLNLRVYGHSALAAGVLHEFEEGAHALEEKAAPLDIPLAFTVAPYLQFGTRDSMTVMWESSVPAECVVSYGENNQVTEKAKPVQRHGNITECLIDKLKPGTQYFYKVSMKRENGEALESELRTFMTAPDGQTPFSFAIISDTQGNPKVSGALAKLAWEQRPSFLLHPGDLVSTGSKKNEWVNQFFSSMNPLISRVPFYPVLGNHEQDAQFYYDYTALPDPSYHYTFTYANTQFFMLDTNKDVSPGSKQYKWLEEQLIASKAKWKFVCHHHPPFSADENDYGDLWKSNKSTHGDPKARKLTALYDKHGVNIVFNGHIHSYERTWPIEAGKQVDKNGTLYLITGGGGGGLETPAPARPPFSNYVRRGHHYAMMHINGGMLEYRAYDLEGQLFDTFSLQLN